MCVLYLDPFYPHTMGGNSYIHSNENTLLFFVCIFTECIILPVDKFNKYVWFWTRKLYQSSKEPEKSV